DGADNIGKQAGGWSITWQGTGNTNADFPGATSIFEGIRAAVTAAGGTATLSADGSYQGKPDVAVVVFGENPYAEWHGDLKSLEFPQAFDEGHGAGIQRPAPEVSTLDEPGPWREAAGDSASKVAAAAKSASALKTADSAGAPVASGSDLALLQRLR